MVFFFKVCNPRYVAYMGRDKVENEELIRHGVPGDVWFHVDAFSSAHVYLRFPDDMPPDVDSIPEDVKIDCAQLTKANSIAGNKKNNIKIVYTMWGNLKKDESMAVGQVSFHDASERRFTRVDTRENAIVNRLNKTKTEITTEAFRELKLERERKQRGEQKEQKRLRAETEKHDIDARLKEEEEVAASNDLYLSAFSTANMAYSAPSDSLFGDDFEESDEPVAPSQKTVDVPPKGAGDNTQMDAKKAARHQRILERRLKREKAKAVKLAGDDAIVDSEALPVKKGKKKLKGKRKKGKGKKGKGKKGKGKKGKSKGKQEE